MQYSRFLISGVLILLCTAAQASTTVENIRIWSENGKTRVVLDLSRPAAHSIFTLRGPDRLVVDLKSSRLAESLRTMPSGAGSVRAIRSAVRANGQLRVVLDLNEAVRSRSFTAVKTASDAYQPGRDVIVAIDAGHGGHDPGAIGRGKTREKDVALQISRTLAARINAEPGMTAVLVRNGDYYVDHRERVEIARRSKADLFVSVHADAVKDSRAGGASVYALSLKGASDEAARQLAERENASVRVGGVTLDDKDEVLASVLLDLSQSAALSASLDVGSKVIGELARLGKVHRRTVQQAGFLVLKSPDMPSILVETAFISNPSEEKKLRDARHQGQLADAILAGVRTYFYTNPPPDTRVAMEMRRVPAKQVRHVIARGDTLSEIAARYNVSPAAIRAANKLSSDRIRVGQTLSIPLYAGT